MRTNIVLDEELVNRAKELTGITITRGVVLEALAVLVQLREQAYARTLRGQLRWEGDLARFPSRSALMEDLSARSLRP